jgi:hypothetical protein
MTHSYRGKGAPEQGTERDKQKLDCGLLAHRKGIASLSARIRTLNGQVEREIAQAIWDDVPLRTVASATGVTTATARSVVLAFLNTSPAPVLPPNPTLILFGP